MTGKLILVRHGQSQWNAQQRFTGWVDVGLTEKGIKEAKQTAKKLENYKFDIAFTSNLIRAQETLLLILSKQKYTGIFVHNKGKEKNWSKHDTLNKKEIEIQSSSKLNERYYGKLQGLKKDKIISKFGKEQVFLWRRSFEDRPPDGENLKDVYKRTTKYFNENILEQLKKNKTVIVSAHGNSLRALVKFIENISDFDVRYLELKTGAPIIYEYKYRKFKKINSEGIVFNKPKIKRKINKLS